MNLLSYKVLIPTNIPSSYYIKFNLGGAERYIENTNFKTTTLQDLQEINNNTRIQRDKNSCKLAENTLIGQFILDLQENFIQEINLAESMAFARDETDSTEGSRVKQAIYTLRLIDQLKKIEAIDPNFPQRKVEQERLVERINEKSSELKQGLKNILKYDKALIEKEAAVRRDKNSAENRQKISNRKTAKGGIADDEYIDERVEAAVKDACDKEMDKMITKLLEENGKGLIEMLKSDKVSIPDIVGEKIGDLFDFENKEVDRGPERDLKLLSKVTARHIVILFHTFDNLQKFDDKDQKKMINTFLSEGVMKTQGWEDYENKPNIMLSSKDIEEGMKKYSQLDFQNGNYRMLSSEEIEKLNQPINQSQGRL